MGPPGRAGPSGGGHPFGKAPDAGFPFPPPPSSGGSPFGCPFPQAPSAGSRDPASASSGSRGPGRSLILPLDVSLEEVYSGVTRRVKLNQAQLQRAKHTVSQDVFDVQIEQGAPDGHRVTFPGQANKQPEAEAGDVCFVLQERRHACWRRKGADLFTERSITLLEALTGYQLVIEHLDGRKLLVKSRPGEIVRPRNLLLDAEAEWDRHEDTDAFPGEDAGCMRTDDVEACKEVCRQRGLNGFTYWEDTAYFRAQPREGLLAARKKTKGSTLFICPDPSKSASVRMQRAIRGAGMPCFGDPTKRGNLFLLLKVELPPHMDAEAAELLREVLPPAGSAGTEDVKEGVLEELHLVDLDLTHNPA